MKYRSGDWVVVLSKEEILATLHDDGTLERLPFMPEMLAYCGRRMQVWGVAHKPCDPAHKTGSRWLANSVYLTDARCDGSAHGGCEARCLLFWKTAWIRPADESAAVSNATATRAGAAVDLGAATRATTSTDAKVVYSCQATRLHEATVQAKWWDPRTYALDLISGNVGFGEAARLLLLSWLRALTRMGVGYRVTMGAYRAMHRMLLGREAPEGSGRIPLGQPTPRGELHLEPGDWVRVKSNREIVATLSVANRNRGLWFDDEMVPFCGGTYRVAARVTKIINEVSGEMMEMKSPCITLEGVACRSLYSKDRLFCRRAILPYWRENWLEQAGPREKG